MTHRHTSTSYPGRCCCFTSTDPDLDSYRTTKKRKKNAKSLKCNDETNLTPRKKTQRQHTKTTNPNPCIKPLLPNTIKTAEDVAPTVDAYPIHHHGNSFASHENISLSCSEGTDHDCGPSFDSSSCRSDDSLHLKRTNMNDWPECSKVKHSLQTLSVLPDDMESNETVNISVPNSSAHPEVLVNASDSGVSTRGHSSSLSSQDCSLIHQEPPADNSKLTQAKGLSNMKLQSSLEEFTPDFTGDEDDETYWFQCSCPGLYQCRVSGLVFDMKGEGDVFYRIVPWSRRSLSQHGKKPAGPLFDIRCQQQSVAQLHLPHCEIRSTGGCHFLSVAHVHDEGIEFIRPEKITETHVIISITGFSAFGNVKDEDSPSDPVQALVLLFYKPPADPESDHQINVLMLPKNVVPTDVLRFRKKLDEDERFLETPPHCKLQPKQLYTLSTCPGEDSVLVQPTEAEFDAESYDNYLPTFQVIYEKLMKHIKLFLRDSSSSSVWERRVCLSAAGGKRSCGPTQQNLSPKEQLMEIRTSFMDGISVPVLQSLLDRLLEKKVLNDSERETAEGERTRRDKAKVLVDTVRRKGDAASSEMIHFLCELDPFLFEHLGLMGGKVLQQ